MIMGVNIPIWMVTQNQVEFFMTK